MRGKGRLFANCVVRGIHLWTRTFRRQVHRRSGGVMEREANGRFAAPRPLGRGTATGRERWFAGVASGLRLTYDIDCLLARWNSPPESDSAKISFEHEPTFDVHGRPSVVSLKLTVDPPVRATATRGCESKVDLSSPPTRLSFGQFHGPEVGIGSESQRALRPQPLDIQPGCTLSRIGELHLAR